MEYTTTETEWPSSANVSEDKQKLLDYYLRLLDTNEATTGDKLAEIFADDGYIISPAGTARGHERRSSPIELGWGL
ncbi:uncharacterized protein PV06_09548 [Exophiala oligosperma]|uniref:SnoaL-like domain-containing protein n=1 Tax=Exophiala oligosperma TaxID=215243 RepID=A0A0D2D5Z4_9EURO|nr:uncharacterized protein PV06_09548 [Exophiala oligosperma]KIW38593.1 hypothetical protein PV06_09548 [Exophiala oligosperma]